MTWFGTAGEGGTVGPAAAPTPRPPCPPQPSCPKSSVNFFTLRRSSALTVGRVVASERSMSDCNTGGWARGSDWVGHGTGTPTAAGHLCPMAAALTAGGSCLADPRPFPVTQPSFGGAQDSRGVDWGVVSTPRSHSPAWPLAWRTKREVARLKLQRRHSPCRQWAPSACHWAPPSRSSRWPQGHRASMASGDHPPRHRGWCGRGRGPAQSQWHVAQSSG